MDQTFQACRHSSSEWLSIFRRGAYETDPLYYAETQRCVHHKDSVVTRVCDAAIVPGILKPVRLHHLLDHTGRMNPSTSRKPISSRYESSHVVRPEPRPFEPHPLPACRTPRRSYRSPSGTEVMRRHTTRSITQYVVRSCRSYRRARKSKAVSPGRFSGCAVACGRTRVARISRRVRPGGRQLSADTCTR